MKKCIIFKIEKPYSNFNKHSKTKDKLNSYCKSCVNEITSEWRKNNREHMNKYRNNYIKERKAIDDSFRLACDLRSRLRKALLSQVTNKHSKTEELLGISFDEFKKYIEFLMTPEMTWKSISLDHVLPLSSFDLTNPEQLKQASNYTNIQPLLKSDNCKKGSRLHDHDIAFQRNNLYEYEYYIYYCC